MKEGDAPGVAAICCNHPIYNRLVQQKLGPIFDDYREICNNAKKGTKEHEIPNAELDKKRLERLSRTLMNKIIAWGTEDAGASLDKHSAAEGAPAGAESDFGGS